MEKPNILIFVPYLKGTGGTETVIKNLNFAYMKSPEKDLYDLKLISFGGTKFDSWAKCWRKKVYNFSNHRFLQMFCYIFLMPFLIIKVIHQEKPTGIICTNPIIWEIVYYIKKIFSLNFKIYGWYHYSLKQKKLSYRSIKRCDSFLAISTGIARQLVELGFNKKKISILNNPVIIGDKVNIIDSTRKTLEKAETEFLYVGRIDFDGQKNVQELFNSLAKVSGNWNLNLFGTCSSTDMRALKDIADNYGFQDKIHFNGYNPNVWETIKKADALILTSHFEGFPMILCEAISHGIYCVSANCETGPSDIINENNGRLYDPGDVDGLSRILSNIVEGVLVVPNENQISKTMEQFNQQHFILNFERAVGIHKHT